MSARLPRRCAVVIAVAFTTLASIGSAAEIQMRDGTEYLGVTITRRDAISLDCYSQRGKITLAVMDIARIDGIRVEDIPDSAYAYVSPTNGRPGVAPAASVRPIPRPLPTVAPSVSPIRKSAAAGLTPGPRNTPVSPSAYKPPTPSLRTAQTVQTPRPTPTPPLLPATSSIERWNRFRIGSWAALIAALAVWVLSVVRVRRNVRGTDKPHARTWMVVAIVLPVVGYLFFELARAAARWRRVRPVSSGPRREFVFLDADHRPILIKTGEEASGLENAKGVLQDALLDRASDVHIEPGAAECRVRYRIDGVLQPRMKFSAEEGLRLISALKTVAQLDIAERRKAQDGRFGGKSGDREFDFRAATTPAIYGEKLVLRILDQKSGLRGLADLGMSERMMKRYAEVIQSRSGMILATGPTGSGKTSSLYAALTQLDKVRLNIVTIEDPVEYELPGATQIPVNVKAGVTYESGLRSILRQDPDVILVGEMRDLEAAQIALRSALTGHLVFTSLHTRDAIGTLHRLEEMGIERHMLASALFVVMSQRLVRILCPACREAYPCAGKELAELGLELPAGEAIYRAVGCRKCEGTGYNGRTGIFEMLILDEELRDAVNAGTAEDAFARLARTKGYRSYREDGAEKVLLGITSVEEVLQAI